MYIYINIGYIRCIYVWVSTFIYMYIYIHTLLNRGRGSLELVEDGLWSAPIHACCSRPSRQVILSSAWVCTYCSNLKPLLQMYSLAHLIRITTGKLRVSEQEPPTAPTAPLTAREPHPTEKDSLWTLDGTPPVSQKRHNWIPILCLLCFLENGGYYATSTLCLDVYLHPASPKPKPFQAEIAGSGCKRSGHKGLAIRG